MKCLTFRKTNSNITNQLVFICKSSKFKSQKFMRLNKISFRFLKADLLRISVVYNRTNSYINFFIDNYPEAIRFQLKQFIDQF